MKEIILSILDSLRDRLKNPFLGAFFISWSIFNWKPLLYILFSESSIESRIIFISDCYSSILINLWFPLIFSFAYIICMPYVLWLFDKIASKAIIGRRENNLNLSVYDFRNKKILAQHESELEDIKASYREKADLNKKIEILTAQLLEKEKLLEIQSEEVKKSLSEKMQLLESIKNNEIPAQVKNEDFEKMFKEFRNSDLFEFFQELGISISSRNSLPIGFSELVAQKFKHSGIYFEERDEENQRTLLKFTPKGEYFWKKYLDGVRITKQPKNSDDLPF